MFNTPLYILRFLIYFTSISRKFIYHLYKAFFEILSSFSKELSDLKTILDNVIEKQSKILSILINHNNSILLQSMTDDFDSEIISDIYMKISNKYLMSEEVSVIMVQIQKTESIIMIQNVIKNNDEIFHPFIRNLIVIFDLPDDKGIKNFTKNIIDKVNKYYLKDVEKKLFVK